MTIARISRGVGVVAVCVALCACGQDAQSVLSPRGSDAERIASIAWLLFGLGAAVLSIVLAALWLAISGPSRVREILAQERTLLALGLVFPAVVLSGLLGYGLWLIRPHLNRGAGAEAIRVEVVGEQWWWRFAYVNGAAEPIASANEAYVPVGRAVLFTLKSADVIHSFWAPSLGGKVDMIPGRTTTLQLTAQRPGIYRGQCAEYCGGPHALMAFHVVALTEEDYRAWWTREASPAAEPGTPAERNGMALFHASGCGACHAVRGTQAQGFVGPDLTHVGSRRSVGIDTVPLTRESLVRFILAGQHIKPGNRMPEFRILTEDQAGEIAAYLLSLK